MKSNLKLKIKVSIILSIFFALSSTLTNNFEINVNNSDAITLDNEIVKLSKVSGKIHIINNSGWVDFESAGNCTGGGTYSNPYVIEDLVIDGGSFEHCIWIENSDVYFRIENCSLYHTGDVYTGIQLENVTHGLLIDNNCTSNNVGIGLYSSDNNTVSGNILNNNGHGLVLQSSNNTLSGNIANNNTYNGISISGFGNNTLLGNTANNNAGHGLYFSFSHNNSIIGNTANYNQYGIYLEASNYNIITGNTLLGNEECIVEDGCEGNTFRNNNCGSKEPTILGYNLLIVLSILSITIILISKKLKKS